MNRLIVLLLLFVVLVNCGKNKKNETQSTPIQTDQTTSDDDQDDPIDPPIESCEGLYCSWERVEDSVNIDLIHMEANVRDDFTIIISSISCIYNAKFIHTDEDSGYTYLNYVSGPLECLDNVDLMYFELNTFGVLFNANFTGGVFKQYLEVSNEL